MDGSRNLRGDCTLCAIKAKHAKHLVKQRQETAHLLVAAHVHGSFDGHADVHPPSLQVNSQSLYFHPRTAEDVSIPFTDQ